MTDKWLPLWWGLFWGICALSMAHRRGLFRCFRASSLPAIRGVDVLKGFAWCAFMELLFIPSLATLFFVLSGEGANHVFHLGWRERGWLNLLTIIGGGVGALYVYGGLGEKRRRELWRQTVEPWYHHIAIGVACWFVIYPLVLAFGQAISLVMQYVFHHPSVEQVAVQQLRKTMADRWLFIATSLFVVTVVPLMEEFLFRGLLQSWLKRTLSHAPVAVGITSVVFALFHYSSSQGLTNIELLCSLFFLSCMLGFVYERQRSLWASVGLHGFFNFMSLLMLSVG